MPDLIEHTIAPVYDSRSRVLVLGSIPSPKSREAGFFYGHPRNRFWQVMAALFDEPVPQTVDEKRDLLLRRHIALWDVAASCEIDGASDASIRNVTPNDFSPVFATADIQAVFTTGTKAGELYTRLCANRYDVAHTTLPSTSPANAKADLPALTRAYAEALLPHLTPYDPPVLDVRRVVELEQQIAHAGTSLATLMERAGRALAHRAAGLAQSGRSGSSAPAHVTVLCGNGNNGGDGWVAARILASQGFAITVLCAIAPENLQAHPAREAALEAQAALEACPHARIVVQPDAQAVRDALASSDIAIDALLGTGFAHDAVRAPFDAWIEAANERRTQGLRIIAADVPSGLNAQTGKAARPCIKADATVTMIVPKPGLATPYAFAFCGTVTVAPLAYIEPLLETTERQMDAAEATSPMQDTLSTGGTGRGTNVDAGRNRHGSANDEFHRPEAEDDDGYDPYSDRRPEPEALFQDDPWR